MSLTKLVKIENLDQGEVTSTNIRYTVYVTAMQLIKQAPLAGYGIGDYNHVLRDTYMENGQAHLYEGQYNAHNQYPK